MQDESLPNLPLNTDQWETEVAVGARRDGKTSSWKRDEECRINKPRLQFNKKKKIEILALLKITVSSGLKIEKASFSETLVSTYKPICRCNTEDTEELGKETGEGTK
jgi:hypothetical protein